MNIKTRFITLFIFLTAMLTAVWFCIERINHHSQATTEAEKVRLDSLRLADHLRQSSDDLTRMARTYVATGEQRYEKYFHDIIDIRNGKAPRPANYDEVYWDYITALGENFEVITGDAVSYVDLFKRLGGTEDELNILERALNRSNRLAVIETEALYAMKGVYTDDEGLYTRHGEPDQALAIKLLHSVDYHQAKAAIMHPIEQFYEHIDSRTALYLERARAQQDKYEAIAMYLMVGLALYFLYSFFQVRNKIVNPILELSEVAKHIKAGKSEVRAKVFSKDEIGQLAKSFNEMNDNLSQVISELKDLSYIDPLTQVANRRVFDQTLSRELRRHKRNLKPLSLLLIDVDYFKRLNDSAGHQLGDQCLMQIAAALEAHFKRAGDLVARYGGEEFAAILSETEIDNVEDIPTKVCEVIENAGISHPNSSISKFVTVSVGAVSMVPEQDTTSSKLINVADNALYRAKEFGRNRAELKKL